LLQHDDHRPVRVRGRVHRRGRDPRPDRPERPPGRLVLGLPGRVQHQHGGLRHRRRVRGYLDRGPGHLALRPDRAEVGGRGGRREDLMTSDVLDEAYGRLHRWGPEWGGDNGLSNHGPMAAEVLARRGYEDQVEGWLDRYVARLVELPGESDPITADNWRDAMGELARVGDWVAYFRRAVRAAPWPEVLAAWWPRLLPAIASGATHGLIRTGHAVRTAL